MTTLNVTSRVCSNDGALPLDLTGHISPFVRSTWEWPHWCWKIGAKVLILHRLEPLSSWLKNTLSMVQ
jgi:hypothetical protein